MGNCSKSVASIALEFNIALDNFNPLALDRAIQMVKMAGMK